MSNFETLREERTTGLVENFRKEITQFKTHLLEITPSPLVDSEQCGAFVLAVVCNNLNGKRFN